MEPGAGFIPAVTVWALLQKEATLQGDAWQWVAEGLLRGSGGFD